jgi:HSP20 family protein
MSESRIQNRDSMTLFRDPFFGDMFEGFGSWPVTQPHRTMKMDLVEQPEQFIAKLDMPGVSRDDIQVSLDENLLTIKAEKSSEKEERNERWHVSERSYGSMSRSIRLPENADFEHINAAYENGVLTLNIPKLATPKSNKKFIDIN